MNGKGSKARNNFSKRFRDNYSEINWSTSTRISRTLGKYLDVIKTNLPKLENPRPSKVINEFHDMILDKAMRRK